MGDDRKRHLTRGWCWRADIDGDPAVWGIYGHIERAEALDIVQAYEECHPDDLKDAVVTSDWRRNTPCRAHDCCGECNGSHLTLADGPGRGASPYTWVEANHGN